MDRSGEGDGLDNARDTCTCEVIRRPAGFLEGDRGILKRDVTTVQRWEKREGMPVHRHQHDKAGTRLAGTAYQEHSNILQLVKVHPYFDPLRGDPRFTELVHRVGLD